MMLCPLPSLPRPPRTDLPSLAAAEMNKDIWDWKDLHMGPGGKTCGNRDYNLPF